MDECEGVAGVAVGANCGLSNATSVNLNCGGEGTNMATEEGLAHFRDDVGRANHHATDGDELVNVWKKRLPLTVIFLSNVPCPKQKNISLIYLYLESQEIVKEPVLIQLGKKSHLQ